MNQAAETSLIATARAEAARMRVAVRGLQGGGMIRLHGEQFAKLATLIETLAERAAAPVAAGFETPIDGIRWWVPLPEVQRERAELARLREQHEVELFLTDLGD